MYYQDYAGYILSEVGVDYGKISFTGTCQLHSACSDPLKVVFIFLVDQASSSNKKFIRCYQLLLLCSTLMTFVTQKSSSVFLDMTMMIDGDSVCGWHVGKLTLVKAFAWAFS